MNKQQTSKQRSYLSISSLFASAESKVSSLAGLEQSSSLLDGHLTAIDANATVQASPSGASQAKQSALEHLGDCAVVVAAGVHAHADAIEDLELAGKVDFSRSAIIAGSGAAVVARCKGILAVATEHAESLPDHGVTAAKITALKSAIKTYDGLRTLPRDAGAARTVATKQLKRLFPQVDRLLAKRIDKQMLQFKSSDPEFYDKYQAARVIVDPASKAKKDDADKKAA